MTRRKRQPNENPLHEITGTGAAIRAGGGGHCRSVYYDDEPMRSLKNLPPRRFPPIISAVPTRPATPEDAARRRRYLNERRPAQDEED